MKFQIGLGARISKKETKVVATELTKISTRFGKVTADLVVEGASTLGSPLHGFFEWDNRKAGHQYRLEQARALLRSVDVVIERQNGRGPLTTRAFVFIGSQDAYFPAAAVMSNEDFREEALQSAVRELEYFHRKYENLRELSFVFSATRKAVRKFKKSTSHKKGESKSVASVVKN